MVQGIDQIKIFTVRDSIQNDGKPGAESKFAVPEMTNKWLRENSSFEVVSIQLSVIDICQYVVTVHYRIPRDANY